MASNTKTKTSRQIQMKYDSRQRQHDALRAFPALRNIEDPFAGVIDERAFLYSGDAEGNAFLAARSWEWNPTGAPPQISVHRDGHSTAHGGTIGNPVEDAHLRMMRLAGCTDEQIQVKLLTIDEYDEHGQLLRRALKHYDIAGHLGISLRQVERRIKVANLRIAAYAKALKPMLRVIPIEACEEQ